MANQSKSFPPRYKKMKGTIKPVKKIKKPK